jgi:hypothetical protein
MHYTIARLPPGAMLSQLFVHRNGEADLPGRESMLAASRSISLPEHAFAAQ